MAKVCVIAGVGPGNGASLCRKFSSEGNTVAMLARNDEQGLGGSQEQFQSASLSMRWSSPEAINRVFMIFGQVRSVETLIYNAGSGSRLGLWRRQQRIFA